MPAKRRRVIYDTDEEGFEPVVRENYRVTRPNLVGVLPACAWNHSEPVESTPATVICVPTNPGPEIIDVDFDSEIIDVDSSEPDEEYEDSVDFGARFNVNGVHAVRELQRYIDELPLTFEFRNNLKTNLMHLKNALAGETDYPMSIQQEGEPWNDLGTGVRSIFTGCVRLKRKRRHLFFDKGMSFERYTESKRKENVKYRAQILEGNPEEVENYHAKRRQRQSKVQRTIHYILNF
jgi:hypothetical protein